MYLRTCFEAAPIQEQITMRHGDRGVEAVAELFGLYTDVMSLNLVKPLRVCFDISNFHLVQLNISRK